MAPRIVHDGKALEAAECPVCHGRVAPASELKGHLARHKAGRRYMMRVWLKPLQKALKRSRL